MTFDEEYRAKAMELALAWTSRSRSLDDLIQVAAQIEDYLRNGVLTPSLAG